MKRTVKQKIRTNGEDIFPFARLVLSAGLFFLSLSLPLAAQNAPLKLEDPPWLKDVASRRIVYTVPGMNRARVRRDLIYKRVGATEMAADVYAPARRKRGARLPAVIFIHGGALPPNLLTTPKEWGVYKSYGELSAASGLVGVTFNHRYHGYEYLDEAGADVADLIAYVRANADSLGVDRERIFVWAFSAGGIFLGQTLREAPAFVRGVLAFYPLLDLRPARAEAPASVADQTLRDFSPLYLLGSTSKKMPPMFVARAGRDDANLNRAVDEFVREATVKNVDLEFLNHAAGRHGFDVFDDDERTREIIKRAIEFIKAND